MNILVCIKPVPDESVDVSLDKDNSVVFSDASIVVNSYDRYALEAAVRIKESVGGTVSVISVSDYDAATPVLRSCLSVGADDAAVVQEDANEEREKWSLLGCASKALPYAPFDVIICGIESSDISYGETGIALAEYLDLPIVTRVVSVEAQANGKLMLIQETETCHRRIEVPTPCVLTFSKPDYEPRYPTIKSKIAARKSAITLIGSSGLIDDNGCPSSIGKTRRVAVSLPPQRSGGVLISEETAEESVNKALSILFEQNVI